MEGARNVAQRRPGGPHKKTAAAMQGRCGLVLSQDGRALLTNHQHDSYDTIAHLVSQGAQSGHDKGVRLMSLGSRDGDTDLAPLLARARRSGCGSSPAS